MICGIDSLKNWITNNNIIYWQVDSANEKNTLYESPQTDGQTLNDSLSSIDACFSMFGSGRYFIEGATLKLNDPKVARKKLRIPYEHIGKNTTATQPNVGTSINVEAEIERRMKDFQLDWELKQTKNQVEELKKALVEKEKQIKELEKGSAVDRVVGKLEPAINMWLNNTQSQKAALSGPISAEDYTSRLEKAFDMWKEPDEITKLELIEKLSKLSVNNPTTYTMGKTMLMQQ